MICVRKHRLWVAVFASLAVAGWSQNSAIVVESASDGHNSQWFQTEGKWVESAAKSSADGLKATRTVYNDANQDPGSARFTPELPQAGKYEIFITYPTSGNASDIKYVVHTADGDQHLEITQFGREASAKPAANQWYSLGVYNFNAGQEGYVELSDPLTGERPQESEPNARIYADAVMFAPVSDAIPVTPLNDSSTTAASAAPDAADDSSAAPPADPDAMAPITGEAAATETAQADMPSLSPAPAPGTGTNLPSLPDAAAGAANLPALPDAGAAAPALPALPAATPATAQLPSLPAATPDAGQLPSLPAATPATAQLPALPAATPAADQLPGLPTEQASALPGLPDANAAENLPALPAAPTPDPISNLPSLATVTPTPAPQLPSPADTPVPAAPGLAGASPLTPSPSFTPAVPAPPDFAAIGAGVPTPIPTGEPLPAVSPSPTPGAYSITTHNPSDLPWMYDYGAALKAGRQQNKRVMVFFTSEHSRMAHEYETITFADPGVRQALSNYVLIKADFSRNTRLAYNLGVFGSGVVVVVDGDGTVRSRVIQRPAAPTQFITELSSDKPARGLPDADAAPAAPGVTGAPAPAAPTAPAAPAAPVDQAPDGIPALPADGAALPPAPADLPADPGALPPAPAPGAPAELPPAAPAPDAAPDGMPALPELPALPGQ